MTKTGWTGLTAAIVMAAIAGSGFAAVTNGDFSAGLNGWTVASRLLDDTIVNAGVAATFDEKVRLQFEEVFYQNQIEPVVYSVLSQSFTLDNNARSLLFDYDIEVINEGGGPSETDEFYVEFLDENGNPLLHTDGRDSFYFWNTTGFDEFADGVQSVGNSIQVDLLDDWLGRDVTLRFTLFSDFDSDDTSVTLDNVRLSAVPAPSAVALGVMGLGCVAAVRRKK